MENSKRHWKKNSFLYKENVFTLLTRSSQVHCTHCTGWREWNWAAGKKEDRHQSFFLTMGVSCTLLSVYFIIMRFIISVTSLTLFFIDLIWSVLSPASPQMHPHLVSEAWRARAAEGFYWVEARVMYTRTQTQTKNKIFSLNVLSITHIIHRIRYVPATCNHWCSGVKAFSYQDVLEEWMWCPFVTDKTKQMFLSPISILFSSRDWHLLKG